MHAKAGAIDWSVAKKLRLASIRGTIIGILLVIYMANKIALALNVLLAVLVMDTAVSELISIGVTKFSSSRLPVFGGGFIDFYVTASSIGKGAVGTILGLDLIVDKKPK